MGIRFRKFYLLGLVVFTVLLLAACQPRQPDAPTDPGISVVITGSDCPGIVVRAGEQVTWTNQDSREHTVQHVPEAGESQFSSGTLKPKDSFAFTFVEPGTYLYSCSAAGVERGTVTVEP